MAEVLLLNPAKRRKARRRNPSPHSNYHIAPYVTLLDITHKRAYSSTLPSSTTRNRHE